MSKQSGDGFWEGLVVVLFCGLLAVFGYRKLKPAAEGWLEDRGVHVDEIAEKAGAIPLDGLIDIGAALVGIGLLVTIFLAVRGVRRRGRDDKDKKKKVRAWR